MSGKLIVIEGLDGSGKSTQWEMLKKLFVQARFITFPDYDSESGRIIKRYLAGDFSGKTAYSASSFYAVDRYISYKDTWGEAYQNGTNIISARYTSSNAIYQMTKLNETEWQSYLDWLCDYEHRKLGIPVPDLTVFLDVPVEISQNLLAKRYESKGSGSKDIHEGDVEYLKECRKAALYAANQSDWVNISCVESGKLRNPRDINRELAEIIGEALK